MTRRIKVEPAPDSSSLQSNYGKALDHDPNFKGPLKNRSCTDLICLFLFLGFLIGWIIVGVFAAYSGNPSRFFYPTDSYGQVCGKDDVVKDKPYLFFFDITRCASPKVPFTGCPTPQICVKECPKENWFYSPLETNLSKFICKYNVHLSLNQSIHSHSLNEDCAFYYVDSISIAHRCFPVSLYNFTDSILDSLFDGLYTKTQKLNVISDGIKYIGRFAKLQELAEGVVEDVGKLWGPILIGCAIAMLVSLLWIVLLRIIASIMVWFSLVAFTILSGFGAYYTMNKYLNIQEQTRSTNMTVTEIAFSGEFNKVAELETTWLVFFIITVTVFLVCFILAVFLRKRIRLAIALINEASKAVWAIKSSLFFPIVSYALHTLFVVVFCVVFFLLASSGAPQYRVVCHGNCSCSPFQENSTCNPTTFLNQKCTNGENSCQFYSYEKDALVSWLHVYNLFAFFWIQCFISALGEMILAGAFVSWYWSFKKPHDVPKLPLLRSSGRTLRYHIGTLAFGALIIAIVRLIRCMFERINHKVKKYADNVFFKAVACMCRCCLWCLEKFLRFVNRNAYIQCAIYGKNFCHSARKSFSLIMRNIARVVVLDKVTDFLLLIGKLVVVAVMAILSYFVFSGEIGGLEDIIPQAKYYMTPVVIITVATCFIVSSFFNVYAMAVDSLFICFLEDVERNDGSAEKPYFMSKSLMQILDKSNKIKSE